jgi:hypothetical protein
MAATRDGGVRAAGAAASPPAAVTLAEEWERALRQFHAASMWAACVGGAGLLWVLAAAVLDAAPWLVVAGLLPAAGSLGFFAWLHRRVRREGALAIAEYRQALALLASLQETADALTDLVAALRLSSLDGVRAIDDSVNRVADTLRRLPLIGNPLTELGLGVVTGLSHAVVETADHAALLASGIERAVGDLDVSEMERQSKSARELASSLRRRVEGGEGKRVRV